jgi:hypothetical protein
MTAVGQRASVTGEHLTWFEVMGAAGSEAAAGQ